MFLSHEKSLLKLINLAHSISCDPLLLDEMSNEIQSKKASKAICTMFKQLLKKDLLKESGIPMELIEVLLINHRVSEFMIYESEQVVVTCFIMAKGAHFPLHDHPNHVVCTGVLSGKIKFLSLNPHSEDKWYTRSKKGTCTTGQVMFCTKTFRNIHMIVAVEDTVMIDIFIPNARVTDTFNIFTVQKRIGEKFLLTKSEVQCSAR